MPGQQCDSLRLPGTADGAHVPCVLQPSGCSIWAGSRAALARVSVILRLPAEAAAAGTLCLVALLQAEPLGVSWRHGSLNGSWGERLLLPASLGAPGTAAACGVRGAGSGAW